MINRNSLFTLGLWLLVSVYCALVWLLVAYVAMSHEIRQQLGMIMARLTSLVGLSYDSTSLVILAGSVLFGVCVFGIIFFYDREK